MARNLALFHMSTPPHPTQPQNWGPLVDKSMFDANLISGSLPHTLQTRFETMNFMQTIHNRLQWSFYQWTGVYKAGDCERMARHCTPDWIGPAREIPGCAEQELQLQQTEWAWYRNSDNQCESCGENRWLWFAMLCLFFCLCFPIFLFICNLLINPEQMHFVTPIISAVQLLQIASRLGKG